MPITPTSALGAVSSIWRRRYAPHIAYAPLSSGPTNRVDLQTDYRSRHRKLLTMFLATSALVFIFYLVVSLGGPRPARHSPCEQRGTCVDISSRSWGQYSPFFSVPSEIDPAVPQGCELTLGVVLSRHGARDPTSKKGQLYEALVARIQDDVHDYAPGFEFIRDFRYTMGEDMLTALGEQQMVDSGVAMYERYGALVTQDDDLFVRAAGSDRVVASAEKFVSGFNDARGSSSHGRGDVLVIPETEGSNNTLDASLCTEFEDGPPSELGKVEQRVWMAEWVPPITERLNAKLPGARLTAEETIFMMDLCPFLTVASPQGTHSHFCALFSPDEWRSYDYFESLDKWYGHGPGNPLGPTQGVGYVNELIARLTGQPVEDGTSTNSTLDSSNVTFPLDRPLYADFSHDNLMTSVYGALGLFQDTQDLPPTERLSPEQTRGYSAAWTTPFAGRMYVEKMQCRGGEMVRVLLNDRVMPLSSCGGDEHGRCTLDEFVESLSFARNGGLWDECFA